MKNLIEKLDKLLLSKSTDRTDYVEAVKEIEKLRKQHALDKNEQEANLCWMYKSILEIYELFLGVFEKIKSDNHMDAWVDLERCEIAINTLEKNSDADFCMRYGLNFFKAHVANLQSLFPFNVFFSPGYIVGYYACSICGHKVRPRSRCEHIKGKLYNGEICYHIVNEAEMLEVSLVTNPVQKYSVIQKDYDYKSVDYVVDRLSSPFEPWKMQMTTKAYPREMFASVSDDDICPCRSDKKFIDCCFKNEYISIPHMQIWFSKPLPPELQTEIFPYDHS